MAKNIVSSFFSWSLQDDGISAKELKGAPVHVYDDCFTLLRITHIWQRRKQNESEYCLLLVYCKRKFWYYFTAITYEDVRQKHKNVNCLTETI